MKLLRFFPLFGVMLIVYNVIMLGSDVFQRNPGVIEIPLLRAESPLVLRAGELFAMIGVVLLYFELLKATRTSREAIFDHMLSTAVLIACLVEFLVVPGAGTAAFMFLTLLALIDLISGFTITIVASRRDIAFGDRE